MSIIPKQANASTIFKYSPFSFETGLSGYLRFLNITALIYSFHVLPYKYIELSADCYSVSAYNNRYNLK